MINEIVLEPQQDWNDSGAGGNGVPFDDQPGTSTTPSPDIDANDRWIELKNQGRESVLLTNWSLVFVDTLGVEVAVPLGEVTLLPGEYLVVENPGDVAFDSILKVVDGRGLNRDVVDLAELFPALGPATGVADEAMARVPDGNDTNSVADFERKAATIGAENPAE